MTLPVVSRMTRIIPAYAGLTICPYCGYRELEDHPRLRGVNLFCRLSTRLFGGSSPLTRG